MWTSLVLAVSSSAWAASADADALDLESEPVHETSTGQPSKLFVEAALGVESLRYGLGSREVGRVALDGFRTAGLGPALRYTLSARLDASHPEDPRIGDVVFSLREAFASWQDEAATTALQWGRINLRSGPAYGYNPTDFFRDNALRTATTVNPFSLRENRLGSVMALGQHLWSDGSVALAYSPKVASGRSDSGLSADWGATNSRNRGLATLSTRWSEMVSTQALLYQEEESRVKLGASATALLTDAAVAHAEWSRSHEVGLATRALADSGPASTRNRVSAGFTYSTATRLSVTAEYEYNGFALDREGWRSLAAAGPAALGAYYLAAQALQENAAREAIFIYAVQKDLVFKNLDLTALLKLNRTDRSQMAWIDLRYRLEKWDVALQVQRNSGASGSEFGIAPVRDSAALVAVVYY